MLGHLSAAFGASERLRYATETGAAKQAAGNTARIRAEMIRARKLDLVIMFTLLARPRQKIARHRRSLTSEAAASAARRRSSPCAAGRMRENSLFRLSCLNLVGYNPYTLQDILQVNNIYSGASDRFCNAASSAIGGLCPISDDAEPAMMLKFLLINIFIFAGIAIRIPTESRKSHPTTRSNDRDV